MITLLIIEDERPLLEEVSALLSFEDFDVLTADNGWSGVQLAQDRLPDLIICDITMDGMDGYEVLSELRKSPQTMAIPFMFLTARSDKSFMRYGMELGADDYLTKPFTREELLSAIDARLARHSSLAEAHKRELEDTKVKLTRLIAHELRTPLSSIQLVKDVVEQQWQQLDQSQIAELMKSLGSGTERLNHMVEQMVYIARLDAGFLSREAILNNGNRVAVSRVIQGAIRQGRRFAYKNKEIEIVTEELDQGAFIIANPMALEHALAELVANALNFSPDHSQVVIMLWTEQDLVWIGIRDRGIGMSRLEERLARQAFTQVKRDTREQQGMGLGLTVTQRIIEAHGGRLEFQTSEGKGTQANVRLPLALD